MTRARSRRSTLRPRRVLELARRLLQPKLPARLAQLLLLLRELAVALEGERLALLLLHRISISDWRRDEPRLEAELVGRELQRFLRRS